MGSGESGKRNLWLKQFSQILGPPETIVYAFLVSVFIYCVSSIHEIRPSNITSCGNITSFFIMRCNQAVEVVAGWACSHSRVILKFLCIYRQSLSYVGEVRNVRLPSKHTFRIDCL